MLVRYFDDSDGSLLGGGIVDSPLKIGEPVVLKNGRYVVFSMLPPEIDKVSVLFHPVILKKEK